MNQDDRNAIDQLFEKLREVELRSTPRDPEAEARIRQRIAEQPGAPYYMAQTIVVQEQALEMARTELPDLVITDILMPHMDGFSLVRRLRAEPLLMAMPVIFHTDNYDVSEIHRLARASGILFILRKPAEPHEILRAVNESLKRPTTPSRLPKTGQLQREHLQLLADMLLKSDRIDAAFAVLETAKAVSRDTDQQMFAPEWHRLRGAAFEQRGQHTDAQAAFEDALEVARWQGAKMLEARARAARIAKRAQEDRRPAR